jgi:membrane protease YdiL (CAAX protease family)
MIKLILKGIVVLISGLLFGAMGLFSGAYIGGNYAQNFSLFGVRGYEAAGQLGFILGAIMGVVVSISFLRNRSKS